MSRTGGKPRLSGGSAFGSSPAWAGFGGFSSAASGTSLSYVSEPPNLSGITDSNVIVSFKNLLKKDGTTKAKALEDLIVYVQAHPYEADGGAEEGILEAWVQLYPRTSIDNSRRVRELSHTLQLELMKSARKRMEKRIPKVVGSWLAGTFDRDRIVSRAANDGLSSFLNTDDKVLQFWRRCQSQILEYATEAVAETPDTLSDERSTTKEDADAKFHRVIGGSLSLVLGLLQKLGAADTDKHREEYEHFFSVGAVWSSVTSNDSYVRKTVFQLLSICLERREPFIQAQLPRLGRILISDGLKSTQLTSATDFVMVLTKLTNEHSEIWGEKKHSFVRLRPYLEKGSQGSAPTTAGTYWQALNQLFAVMPQKPVSYDEAASVIKSLRIGVSRREEPRNHAADAWTMYLSAVRRLADIISPEDSRVQFIEDNVYPLIEHYLHPLAERSAWSTGSLLPVVTRAFMLISRPSYPSVVKSAELEWAKLSESFKSRMGNSLPEVSKDYQKSQHDIAEEGSRWFLLVEAIHCEVEKARTSNNTSLAAQLAEPTSLEILRFASELLAKRNYKPFGAASLLDSAFVRVPLLMRKSGKDVVSLLFPAAESQDLQILLQSPSVTYIFSCLNALGQMPEYSSLYESTFLAYTATLAHGDSRDKAAIDIAKLIANTSATTLAQRSSVLQTYLQHTCLECAQGLNQAWELFETAVTFGAMNPSSIVPLIKGIVRCLGDPAYNTESELQALEIVARRKPELLDDDEDLQLDLVTKLLGLMEVSDSKLSSKASNLRVLVEKPAISGEPPLVKIIQENLDNASASSLEIDTIVHQASLVADTGSVPHENLFPSTNVWMEELSRFMQGGVNPSLSLTSGLGGAYLLATGGGQAAARGTKRDRKGLTVPIRMATYVTKLLSSNSKIQFSSLPQQFQAEIIFLLYLVAELASDHIALLGEDNNLWAAKSDPQRVFEMDALISSIREVLNRTIVNVKGVTEQGGLVSVLIRVMVDQTKHLTPLAVYSARALTELLQSYSEIHGSSIAEEQITKFDVMKATSSTVMAAIAFLTGYGEALGASKNISTLCNRLVSDIAGATPGSEKTLLTLVLLSSCMPIYQVGELPVANNRIVFAVKQITTWFEKPESLDANIATESCRALQYLLPCIKDVYGSYWERTMEFCLHLWDRAPSDEPDARLSYIYASIKLVATLETIQEPNDDLEDVLQSFAEQKSAALIDLLAIPRVGRSQPEEIVDTLLCRRVARVPLEHIKDLADLYGLVASESRDIQAAAFGLLHKALPAAQEQLSLDVLLEKRDAKLPDELMSLLLDAPTLEEYPDDALAKFPTPIRSYLLSWHLVFDAYAKASLKVRNDYSEHLKSVSYVGPLLDFTSDVLGHSAAHPLNLDKEGLSEENITSYVMQLAEAELEEKNMHWLLVHLYYLTLKYMPGLFKSWYLDCKSKQTKIAIESWTTKYFSPIIISETLDEVLQWGNSQEPPADDEQELLVKVSKPAREVIAGYEVDELQTSIAIRLPSSYPIDSVSVVGLNRVAVSEKKWQSWLMATQGVIVFSNGSIIDGLIAFRRNVVGALKGQTECAICYSIISSDKKMPDKRCGTCKNLFHRTCLYKWFQTSNQNTCPLCRNPIDYLGADTSRRRGGRED